MAPLVVPEVVMGLALLIWVQGVIFLRGEPAIYFLHCIVVLPYMVRIIVSNLQRSDPDLEEAAMMLGAPPWTAFVRITLPLIGKGVAAALVFAVVMSFHNFTATFFLIGEHVDAHPGAAGQAAMVFTAHAGQGCALQTRMLVPHDRKAEVLEAVAATAERMLPGDPHEASTMVGPLITEAQRDRVEGLVADRLVDGDRQVHGTGDSGCRNREEADEKATEEDERTGIESS